MANEKKMTKVQAFTIAREVVATSAHPQTEEVLAKIDKELEQLAKKNSATSGKPTAKQTANMELGEKVLDYMADQPTRLFTVSELVKEVPDLPENTSAPKMTALLRQDSVKPYIKNIKEKGKSYYQYDGGNVEIED